MIRLKSLGVWLMAITIVWILIPVAAAYGNEFDGLEFVLGYENMTADFHMAVTVEGDVREFDLSLPLNGDLPGDHIAEMLEQVCDPENEAYQAVVCEILSALFSDEVVAAMNAQWGEFIATVLQFLPGSAVSHQFGWPLNNVGSFTVEGVDVDWPCFWDPDTGGFVLLPVTLPLGSGNFYSVDWAMSSSMSGAGAVNAAAGNNLNAEFEASADLNLTADGIALDFVFGLQGDCVGSHQAMRLFQEYGINGN